MKIIKINNHIHLIGQDNSIVSSSIGIISGEDYSLMIDTGASSAQLKTLESGIERKELPGNIRYAIITHFHPDHLLNLKCLPLLKVVASKNTSRYIHVDQIIDKATDLDLQDIKVTVFPLPSVHAKGSIGVYLPKEQITFIGDALCMKEKDRKPYTNKDITINMINTLRSYPTKKYILGHEPSSLTQDQINDYLNSIYKQCKNSRSTDVFLSENLIF